MQAQVVAEINTPFAEGKLQQYHDDIDDDKVLYNRRERLGTTRPEIKHFAKIKDWLMKKAGTPKEGS